MSDVASPHAAANAARLNDVAKRCPSIRIGDIWPLSHWGGPAKVTGFDKIDGMPWPAVVVILASGVTESIGAPAFIGSEPTARGEGRGWAP